MSQRSLPSHEVQSEGKVTQEESLHEKAEATQDDTPPQQEKAIRGDTQPQDVEQQPQSGPPAIDYPPMAKVIPIMAAVYLVFFLVTLVRSGECCARFPSPKADRYFQDRTIIGTAIPQLSNDFHSFGEIVRSILPPHRLQELTFHNRAGMAARTS